MVFRGFFIRFLLLSTLRSPIVNAGGKTAGVKSKGKPSFYITRAVRLNTVIGVVGAVGSVISLSGWVCRL
jgi:hypothetical protein